MVLMITGAGEAFCRNDPLCREDLRTVGRRAVTISQPSATINPASRRFHNRRDACESALGIRSRHYARSVMDKERAHHVFEIVGGVCVRVLLPGEASHLPHLLDLL